MCKNKGLLIYFVLVFAFFSFMGINALAEESIQAVVIGDNVNIRVSPDINSETIKSAALGDTVTIISSKENWYNIQDSIGIRGWILNDLVVPKNIEKDPLKKGKVTASTLNVRENATLNGKIIFTVPKDSFVTIINSVDGWYNIAIDDSQNGWVNSEYIDVIPNYSIGTITGNNVNLRSEQTDISDTIAVLPANMRVLIKDYKDGWYEVVDSEDRTGWVFKEYVMLNVTNNEYIVSRSASRAAFRLIDVAKSLLDKPYVYGASGPSRFDCSGFTSYVFKQIGIEIPRTSKSQATIGTSIKKSELQVGDLVFFDTSGVNNGNISHVGIYIGNGNFIHASSGKSAKRVVISSLTEGYYNEKYVKGRRVL